MRYKKIKSFVENVVEPSVEVMKRSRGRTTTPFKEIEAILEARLLEHLSDNEENQCLKTNASKYICGFEYAKVGLQKDRDGVEKFLYDHYKPECNELDPGGEPIEVNLP
jgi:hypothetical protein